MDNDTNNFPLDEMNAVGETAGIPFDRDGAARTFEELRVYQKARELTNAIYTLTRESEFSRDRGLVDQLRRAAVSIMSNIAEGFERGTKAEFIQFLFIAKGSCGECRAQLRISRDQNYISESDHARIANHARHVSAMLSNFIGYLQKTDYQGEKFARPSRQRTKAHQDHLAALRAAQEVNIRAGKERHTQEQTHNLPQEPEQPRGSEEPKR